MIPDEDIERVRESADIVAIVGEHVPLKRAGADFRGPCPFHQGKGPNFSVSPRRRRFHCFVCGEGGDVFTFLQKRLGLDWPSSVRVAAEKSGITLREVSAKREGPDPREPLWEVNAAALEFFQRMLHDESRGAVARGYLVERGVTMELADRFGVGFVPRDAEALRAALATLGFNDARLLAAGLLGQREDQAEPRVRFRNRLMFPIYDVSARVVGFGGRIIGPGEPKYLNTAENPVFSKGKLLYGLNWARNAMRVAERGLLVEGYFDRLRLAAAGIEEVVAPLGTALTSDQAALLTRYSKNIFLLYDSDRAGLKATFRAGDELLRQGAAVRVVTLPGGEDPDTFVRKYGREGMERAIADAVDVLERKIQLLQRGGWFADLHRRRRAIDHLLPTLRAAVDPVTRDMYVGRVAEASGVDRAVLAGEVADEARPAPRDVRQARPLAAGPAPGPARVPRGRRRATGAETAAERDLVRVMLALRSYVERIGERIGPEGFRDPRYREIFEGLVRLGAEVPAQTLAAALSPESVAALEALLAELDAVVDPERMVLDCLARLQKRALKERNAEIQHLLPAATDVEKNRLMAEKQANVAEIRRLSETDPAA
ncbi:MAG TPA: DNA primase [Gemmatimonadaceae bacterium]|nr:DNA primase [Gemmatimonadaceae bacterium]